MRFLTVSAFAAALLPLASSKSLYIDSTCTSKTGWGTYFLETQNFARRASDRMSSASDTDFKNVFNRIMKTDAGSSDGQYIKSILDQIAGTTVAADPKDADIRLFCDEDQRWEAKQKGWHDPINEMVTQNEPSCLKTNTAGKKTALGRTYERQSKRQGQNSNRVVITICNLAFDSPANDKVPASLSDALVTDQLSQLAGTSVTQFSGMVSSTILHEFAHAVSVVNKKFEVLDLPDKEHAYGWDNIFLNNAADAVKNADNYTFLGIWAGLAEMGFTLVRIKGTEEAIVKEALEGYTEAGRLYQYTDLTKRDLVMIARRFTA